ncbi:PH-like domain-containing protein [Leucobacter sp. HY1910]
MAGVAAALLAIMWLGWRNRTRRDAGVAAAAHALTGAVLAEFGGVQYVSTTLLGHAFERVAVAGLRYKGLADLTVRTDGVSIAVTGETPVTIGSQDLLGTSRSSGRVGKAVEAGGISVLEWRSADGRELESGFRFGGPAEQRAFEDAIAQATTHISNNLSDTTQEDA